MESSVSLVIIVVTRQQETWFEDARWIFEILLLPSVHF